MTNPIQRFPKKPKFLSIFDGFVLAYLKPSERPLFFLGIVLVAFLDALVIVGIGSNKLRLSPQSTQLIKLLLLVAPVYYGMRISLIHYTNKIAITAGHRYVMSVLNAILGSSYSTMSRVSISLAVSTFTQVSRNAIHGCIIQSAYAVQSVTSLIVLTALAVSVSPVMMIVFLPAIAVPAIALSKIVNHKTRSNSSHIVRLFEEESRMITSFWRDLKYNYLEHNNYDMDMSFTSKDFQLRMREANNLSWSGSQRYLIEMLAIYGLTFVYFVASKNQAYSALSSTLPAFLFALYRMLPSLQMLMSSSSLISSHEAELGELEMIKAHADHSGVSTSTQLTPHPSRTLLSFANVEFSAINASRKPPTKEILLISKLALPYTNRVVDLVEINSGSIVYLEGASGSGKTSLLDILSGLLRPEAGTFRLLGQGFDAIRNLVCYLPQSSLPPNLTIADFFKGSRDSLPDGVVNVLHELELYNIIRQLPLGINSMIGASDEVLSGGQLSRLMLAKFIASYCSTKKVFLLDEFTSGNDQEMRALMFAVAKKYLAKPGNLVLYTSHFSSDRVHAHHVISI
jgi:ABC-type multidrug transport system fused ATPase/permease subunit